jgi:hypothetical protein
MGTFEETLNDVIDDDIEDLFGSSSKTIAKMVQQGTKSAIQDTITENPMATSEGQIVVSNSESFLARKLREGRLDRSVSATTSYNGTLVAGTVRAATPDTVLYPTCFNITSNVVATGYFEITTGIADADTIRRYFTLAIGEHKTISLPEGYYVLPTGNIKVYITATSATCTVEVEGIEVSYNG